MSWKKGQEGETHKARVGGGSKAQTPVASSPGAAKGWVPRPGRDAVLYSREMDSSPSSRDSTSRQHPAWEWGEMLYGAEQAGPGKASIRDPELRPGRGKGRCQEKVWDEYSKHFRNIKTPSRRGGAWSRKTRRPVWPEHDTQGGVGEVSQGRTISGH